MRRMAFARDTNAEPQNNDIGVVGDNKRQLLPLESEVADSGPVRRRIESLTIELEPIANILTNEEAIQVRNVIESLLQNYFFEVQPWAVATDSTGSNDVGGRIDVDVDDRSPNIVAEGSVTYVGLAQILENKQTEDQKGVEVTMNGLVYFAEGSQNCPDEIELLQIMEEQALGDSQAVGEALKDFFPAQQLTVTVKTPNTASTTTTNAPTFPIESTTIPLASGWLDDPQQVQSPIELVLGATSGQQPFDAGSSPNVAALGGGVAFACMVLGAVIALFVAKRRQHKASAYRTKDDRLEGVLVDEFGASLQDEWTPNSNGNRNKDDAAHGTSDLVIKPVPFASPLPTEVTPTNEGILRNGISRDSTESHSPTRRKKSSTPPETSSSPTRKAASYLSSIFQRNSPVVQDHLYIESSVSSNDGENNRQSGAPGTSLNMSNFNFTDDSLSDFDDVVSIQPHVVSLQSVESFQKHHGNLKSQQYIVQKDMLGSSFEDPLNIIGSIGDTVKGPAVVTPMSAEPPTMTNTATGASTASNLSYSSSSISSTEQPPQPLLQQLTSSVAGTTGDQEFEDEQEDQRIRYSMMPNPYVRRRNLGKAVEDRSKACVLKATDFTAATLARGSSDRSLSSIESGSAYGANNSLGKMIPKIAAPSWWPSSSQADNGGGGSGGGTDRKRSFGRPSAAVEEAYREDELAYSGDEENTFGVPESDGWDPADAALSSMGDAPTQEEINMVEFHPIGVTGGGNGSPERKSSPSKNVEAAKSILRRMKSPDNVITLQHKLGESIISIISDEDICEEIKFDSSMEI